MPIRNETADKAVALVERFVAAMHEYETKWLGIRPIHDLGWRLSGAFTIPLCILLACLGLLFLGTALNNYAEALVLGVIAGLCWIGMAASIDQSFCT